MFRFHPDRPIQLLLAFGVMLLSLALTLALTPAIAGHSLFILLAGVMVVALFAGLTAALAAALASALAQNYFHQYPMHSLEVGSWQDVMQIVVFLLVAVFVSWIASSLREAYRRAEDARRDALAEGKAREMLLAVVSHDLMNPLTAVRLTAQLIAKSDARLPAQQIIEGVERMERLIRDLLDFERIKQGRITLSLKVEPADSILRSACRLMEPIARSRRITLRCDVPAEGLVARCDRERVLQVLSNLLGNALKFTPPGGQVRVAATRSPAGIRIAVRDTGPGIPAANLPRIFDAYWQANSRNASGIGLGLSIAKGIVEAHGRELQVASIPGIGTEFSFLLPEAAYDAESAGPSRAAG